MGVPPQSIRAFTLLVDKAAIRFAVRYFRDPAMSETGRQANSVFDLLVCSHGLVGSSQDLEFQKAGRHWI